MPDESQILDGGKIKFRPMARLLNLLGNELITDEVIAMVEIVKNSYDADATQVEVKLTDVTEKRKGNIEIRDDGHGMTKEILEHAWMEPARENKKDSTGRRLRTIKFDRLPLGEKGIGRFAVDKLGMKLEIITRFCKFDKNTKDVSELSDNEIVLIIEGKKFTEESYLDEIECEWFSRKPEEFTDGNHGTLLRISDLRLGWSKELIEKVRLGLSRLSSPISGAEDFEINFESNEFPDLSTKIENPLLKIAAWQLDASIDGNGVMHYTISGSDKSKEGSKDLKIGSSRFLTRGNGKKGEYRQPLCGPFNLKLYAFERSKNVWKKYGLNKEKIELLNVLCGVSIYRDGFRVLPYGEPGNDWLLFDKRRVQNPGKVLGNDRVIGYVEISRDSNSFLRDKTNREGLIEEGQAFPDLQELTIIASDFLGLYRYQTQDKKKRSKAKAQEAKEQIDEGTEEIERKVDVPDSLGKIRGGTAKLLEELNQSDEEINNMIALSGIGMTAERMTHELSKSAGNAKKLLKKTVQILESPSPDPIPVKRNLILVSDQLEIIINHIRQMEPLYYSRRSATEKINVKELAEDMKKFYSGTINDLEIIVDVQEKSKFVVEMNRGHLLQIFNNLFDNAFFWLEYSPSSKKSQITIEINGDKREIIFADNGPGVDKSVEDGIFDAFVSTKPDGRGLGLFIIDDILQNYKAEIELITLPEEKILDGANFKITFTEE